MSAPPHSGNPNDDLPSDWNDGRRRTLPYRELGVPLAAQSFVGLLRARLQAALTQFKRVLPQLSHLRIFLDLFGEATNMGIKRGANANTRHSNDELLYVRKTYFSPETLRNANDAVVNKFLALRNPRLWGDGASSCASDGSRFDSWTQNLMTGWHARYKMDTRHGLWSIGMWRPTLCRAIPKPRTRPSSMATISDVVTLSLQLLPNCLMLINTLLIERTIEREGMWERLTVEDLRGLTPLFHGHINPYGHFALDLSRPSFLDAA